MDVFCYDAAMRRRPSRDEFERRLSGVAAYPNALKRDSSYFLESGFARPTTPGELMESALALANTPPDRLDLLREQYIRLLAGRHDPEAERRLGRRASRLNGIDRRIQIVRENLRPVLDMVVRASPPVIEDSMASITRHASETFIRPYFARDARGKLKIQFSTIFVDQGALLGFLAALFLQQRLNGRPLCCCHRCGTFFFVRPSKGAPITHFCSDACARLGRKAYDAERQRRHREKTRREAKKRSQLRKAGKPK